MKNHKSNLYIDESGKSSLKEVIDNPFIMTGVIIEDSEISSIEGYFNFIKRKFEIDINSPFHSYHVFEHPTDKLPSSKLLELSKIFSDFLDLIPAKISILEVNKKEFKRALGVKSNDDFKGSAERKQIPDFPYRVMSSSLFSWFADHLNKNGSIGQIIADSRRGADHHLLNTLNLCEEGHISYQGIERSRIIRDRITAICFSEKNFLSGGLEVTDLISFVAYFKARRILNKNKHIGIDNMWKSISTKANIVKISEEEIRSFFGLKTNEVHKYLR